MAFPIEEQTAVRMRSSKQWNTLRDNYMATELKSNGEILSAPKRSRARFSVQNHLIEMSVEEGMKE